MVTFRGVKPGLSLRNILKQVQFVPKHAKYRQQILLTNKSH